MCRGREAFYLQCQIILLGKRKTVGADSVHAVSKVISSMDERPSAGKILITSFKIKTRQSTRSVSHKLETVYLIRTVVMNYHQNEDGESQKITFLDQIF